jgi:hypothetical protein
LDAFGGRIGVVFRIVGNYGAVHDLWTILLVQTRDDENNTLSPPENRYETEVECEDYEYEDVDSGSERYRECSIPLDLWVPEGTYQLAVCNAEGRGSYLCEFTGGFGIGISLQWVDFQLAVEHSSYGYGEDIKIGEDINYNYSPPVPVTVVLMEVEEGDEDTIYTNEEDVCSHDRCEGSFSTDSLDEGDYKVRVINNENSDDRLDSRIFRVRP